RKANVCWICPQPIRIGSSEINNRAGFHKINQPIKKIKSPTRRKGKIKPKKAMNHQVFGGNWGTKQANRNRMPNTTLE
ncbi:MAG: hypothetical protein RL750_735, partial [Bacteroidota bacterium]